MKQCIVRPWVQLSITRIDLFGKKFSEIVISLRLMT